MSHMKKLVHSRKFSSLLILWGLTAVSCLIIFYPFLFGDKLVVFNDAGSDTRQQYLMQYATIVNHLRDGNFSLWDMNIGFGASMFALNLFNVFLAPVYFAGVVLGVGHMPGVLVYLLLLEIFLAATFCYLFLNCFALSERSKIIASYIYGLNGYLLVWGQHYHFGSFVVFLPLLLFLLERAVRRRKYSLAVPPLVAVMVCSSVYMSYMALLFVGFYLLCRMILTDGTRAERVRRFFAHCGTLLLGLGMGAVIFLPMAHYLLTVSTRLDSGSSFLQRMLQYCSLFPADFYKTAFLRFFSTVFQGIRQYNGYSNFYEAPVLFFSALFVILAPQYVCIIHRQPAARKAKIIQYLTVLFFVLCMLIRVGASVFNAFAYPFSRHSFVFMPLFALMTAYTLDQIHVRRRLHLPALAVSVVLIVCAHVLAFRGTPEPELASAIVVSGVLAALMVVLLAADCFVGRLKATTVLLVFCLLANVTYEGWLCYNQRDVLTTSDPEYWSGLYDPDVTAALASLRESDDSFYRVEKDYFSGSYCMDGLAQDYRGISAYNSTPNRNIEEFVNLVIPNFPMLAKYEYTYRQIGWYTGHSTLFGIKYLLSKNPALALDGFVQSGQFGSVYVYQNEGVSTLARFCTTAGDSAVLKDAYGKADLETMLLDTALLDCGEESVSELIQNLTGRAPRTAEELINDYALEEISTPADITADGSSNAAAIPIDQDMLTDYAHVYLEFDLLTPDVSDITVNLGEPFEYHFRTEAGKARHVQLAVPSSYTRVELSRYGAPLAGEISGIRLLGSRKENTSVSNEQAQITLANPSNDSHLSGTVTASAGGFLFLPLPYEEGWSAAVDGKKAEILRTDIGFLSIPVTAGAHSFTLTYRQPYLRAGLIISLISLAVWAALLLLRCRRRNKAI